VEADLCAPSLAAYLDRDPSRNACTLAHAVRENPHAWEAALLDELQPLSSHCAMGVALCGPPKREMRASIAPAFLERLVAELHRRYRYIVLDVGAELLGMETAAANHRAALASAQQVLLVAGSDLVGLWHARTMLDQFERQLGIERQMVSLVLNRYDPRHHHSRAEVEWHLGAPVVAVIPFDHHATQRAIAQQRPLVVDSGSRASRPLLTLAERLHNGQLRVPEERSSGHTTATWWRRMLSHRGGVRSNASTSAAQRLRADLHSNRRSQAW
jgi:Flp pilus assembly CpaE family ATPase